MEISNQFSILPPGGILPPKGLNAAMEGLVREVLLKNPKDIFTFAAEYFEKLLEIRQQSSTDDNSKEISNLVYIHKSNNSNTNNDSQVTNDLIENPLVIESPVIRKEVEEIIKAEDIEDIMDEVEVIERKIKKSIDIDLKEVNVQDEDVSINNVEENNHNQSENDQSQATNENNDVMELEQLNDKLIKDDKSKMNLDDAVVDQNNEKTIKSPENIKSFEQTESIVLNAQLQSTSILDNIHEKSSKDEENIAENKNEDTDTVEKSSEDENQPEVSLETVENITELNIGVDDTNLTNNEGDNDNDNIAQEVEHLDVAILSPQLSISGSNENASESVQTTVRNEISNTINDEEMENMLNEDNETNINLERTASTNGLGFSENFDDQFIENMNLKRVDSENAMLETSRIDDSEQYDDSIDKERKSVESLDNDMKLNIDLQQELDSNNYPDNETVLFENVDEADNKKSFENNDSCNKDTVVVYDKNEGEKDEIIKAITLIQKLFRGFMVRSKLANVLKFKKSEQKSKDDKMDDLPPINLDRVPELIQANIEPLLYTVPEEKNGSNSTEEESSTFSSAATKIQAGVRGYLTRKYYQLNKTYNSSDTTAPSIGEDSKSFDEIAGTLESNGSDDTVSKIIVATSSIIIEQLEHFEKLESKSFQNSSSNLNSMEMSKESDDCPARTKKRLKREDAIQLNSPYSSDEASANKISSGKISEEDEPIGDLAQSIISEIITKTYSPVDSDQSQINEDSENEKTPEEIQYNELDDEENEKIKSLDLTLNIDNIEESNESDKHTDDENQLRMNESFMSDDCDVVIGSVKLSRPVSKMSEVTAESKIDDTIGTEKETDSLLVSQSTVAETLLNQSEEKSNNIEDLKSESKCEDIIINDDPKPAEEIENVENISSTKSNEIENIESVKKDEQSINIESVDDLVSKDDIVIKEESNDIENKDDASKDELENEKSNNIDNAETAVSKDSKPEKEDNENKDDANADELKPEKSIEVDNKKMEFKGLEHSGEFHDTLLPTKIVRQSSSIKKD